MKKIIVLVALLSASAALSSPEASHFYSVVTSESGKKILNCERIVGGYGEFVSHVTKLFSALSMKCVDANEHFKTQRNVLCTGGSGDTALSFWFGSMDECQKAKAKEPTK